MEMILNISRKEASLEQKAEGVYDTINRPIIESALDFNDVDVKDICTEELESRAMVLRSICESEGVRKVLIDDVPIFFVSTLERYFTHFDIEVVYSHYKSDDKVNLKHVGLV